MRIARHLEAQTTQAMRQVLRQRSSADIVGGSAHTQPQLWLGSLFAKCGSIEAGAIEELSIGDLRSMIPQNLIVGYCPHPVSFVPLPLVITSSSTAYA